MPWGRCFSPLDQHSAITHFSAWSVFRSPFSAWSAFRSPFSAWSAFSDDFLVSHSLILSPHHEAMNVLYLNEQPWQILLLYFEMTFFFQSPCSFGFSHDLSVGQQYFSLTTNQHQPDLSAPKPTSEQADHLINQWIHSESLIRCP